MPAPTQVKTTIPAQHSMVALLGTNDELLKLVQRSFEVGILVRGNEITITGSEAETAQVLHLFDEFVRLLDRGQGLDEASVSATITMVQGAEHPHPSDVLSDEALTHRGRAIRPKTVGQKRYLDAIRQNTLVFGIGPAGTGKTYLAMAMAVLALRRKEVSRIILTRPAVEAGERLGFLPGTLFEKIDPYLRPLFDALHDMMDAEQLALLMERGTIEVAPLAYMRGRAQPSSTPVATPTGFRPIGELRPGDLVVGSDGRPTPVLGVYPQGRKQVFRLRTQDGASTLCCGEHLWAVSTGDERRRGDPPRVLETRDMIGRLAGPHPHRFELPLVQPVEFLPREVPMDPYALGLLLGDGRITGSTTASFATADAELAGLLEAGLEGIDAGHRRGVPVLDRSRRGRGGVVVADPALAVLRDLGLAVDASPSAFVPDAYLRNSAAVRLAVLQGLLDSSGGRVVQSGRTCRVEHVTTSPRVREDVVFLVRSLGGVADASPRPADGGVGISLPAHLPPFRVRRKLATYERHRSGRPLRFVDSIEPEGEAETVCIQVAAADSLYVTEDFLVTHNTLNDSFIVLDEAQNSTAEQMKMFLTRLGFGSKAVVTGDVTQVDLPSGRHSGLRVVRDILQDIDGVAFCELTARDVVRHRIVQEIVEAYRVYDETREADDQGTKGGRQQL